MNTFKKAVALLICAVMLVSACPISILAAGESNTANAPTTYDLTGDYYYRYNFDSAKAGSDHSGYISKVGESDSNPYGFSLDGSVIGRVEAHEDGSGNYYAARYTNSGWRGMRFSLVKDNVDYTIANGLDINFRFRWVGTGVVSDGANFAFVGVRRAKASSRYDFSMLSAYVDQTTGELVIKANSSDSKSYEIYRIPKMSETNKDFTEFRVVYQDVTNTYSVYINGKVYVESLRCPQNPRATDAVTTTYDADFFATRTPVAGASDKWSLQLFRIDQSGDKQFNYHFDVDDIIIKEGDWYANSFETAGTTLNDFSSTTVASTHVFFARKSGATIETEANGNKYLSMNPGSRVDVKDYAYQLFQDGNWSVDFKLRASGAANIMRLFDRVGTHQFLSVTADGALKIGGDVIPDVVVPGVDSDEWVNLTVSVLVDDVNKGSFENFINYSTSGARRGYRIALWVDGEYVGMTANYARGESTAKDGFLLTDDRITTTEITEAELPTLDLTKIAEKNGVITYQDSSANYYQVQYTDGAFIAGVKITKGSQTHEDVLGIFDGGNSQAAIDDLTIYKGVGPKRYATDKSDTEGVVADIDFGKISTTSIHQMTETPYNTGGGILYTNATSTTTHFKRVAATATEAAYIRAEGNTKGSFDVRADYTGGKVFEASITLRDVETKQYINLLQLRRQQPNSTGFVRGYTLTVEEKTNYVYFTQNGTKYYLCDEYANKLDLNTDEWVKLTAIFNEKGSETLVTFLVNDEISYCVDAYAASAPIAFPAVKLARELSGVIPENTYAAKNYYDQRVRLYEMDAGSGFAFDILEASVEYSEVPESNEEVKTYFDYAMIDFSDYNNIDELKAVYGEQIYINGNVTIENGVLNVPAGARFAWLDMNGTFAKHWPESQAVASGMVVNGYTVEMRLKTDFTGDGLLNINLICGADNVARTAKLASLNASGDQLVVGGSTQTINKLSSDKFSDVSFTFTNNAMFSTLFVDGTYAGIPGFWKQFNANDKCVSFEVPSGSQLEKLYIHADIRRDLAMESGEVFRLDPTIYNPVGSNWKSISGITNGGGMLKDSTYTSVLTDESGDESFDYFRIDFKHADDDPDSDAGVNTGHAYTDISLTDYLTDKASVIEFNFRFTPHEKESGIKMNLVLFRLATGANTSHFSESVLDLAGNGTLYYLDKVLRDANGDPIVLSSEEWTNVAAIYDAPAGQVSFRIGGKVPYYLDGENLVLADKIQLNNSINYRLDTYETRMRTFSCAASSTNSFYGTLDVAYLDIYTIDSTANAGYVGVQTDDNNNIRLVAGADMLYYTSVGFEVEAFDANGNPLAESSKDYASKTVYSSIVETVEGNEKKAYPEDYGYRYFYTATVEGIPQTEAVKLNVTPFTTIGGVKYNASTVTLDIDFTKGENTVTTKSVEAKPVGDNSDKNSNFSLTDVVTYTNDGGLDFNGRGAQFGFAADLDGGVVSVNLTNSFGETAEATELELYIDGVLADELVLDFGHHTLVLAEGLKGEHSFKLVKKTGGDYVRINNFSVNGEIVDPPLLAEENAVNIVLHAPEGTAPYGSANVYVRTSDPSGKYYIGYQFTYINWGLNEYDYSNGKSNSHNNAQMYRINTATLVEKTATGYVPVFEVLQGGEISLAIKEVWNGSSAKDFVGGWHGDENIEDGKVYWYLDGEPIDITKAGNYTGSQFVFDQTCLIDRCDTEETQIMRHRQYMVLDTNGLRNKQTVEFLVGDFVGDRSQTYLQMCTFNRQNFSLSATERVKPENYLCDAFNMLDANGNVLSSHDVSTHVPEDGTKTMGYSDKNRYVEYLGNNNGLYGLVGFTIDNASMYLRSMGVMVRETQGDNKLYASFANHFAASVPKYEVWSVDDYYYIDYNTANISAN